MAWSKPRPLAKCEQCIEKERLAKQRERGDGPKRKASASPAAAAESHKKARLATVRFPDLAPRVDDAVAAGVSMLDWCCGYGAWFVPPDDPIFSSAEYLAAIKRVAEQGVVECSTWMDPFGTHDQIAQYYRSLWRQLDARVVHFVYELTASSAANLLPSVLHFYHHSDARKARFPPATTRSARASARAAPASEPAPMELLFFQHSFGAARGYGASCGVVPGSDKRGPTRYRKDLELPNPCCRHFGGDLTTREEKQAQHDAEQLALRQLEEKCKANPNIGGLVIEPIMAAHGMLSYRRDFVRELCNLCADLRLVVVADEVLTAPRTGRTWAFDHYDGDLVPDYVLTGKGLLIAGIARFFPVAPTVAAAVALPEHDFSTFTTKAADSMLLLRSARLLQCIIHSRWVDNGRVVGERLARSLRGACGHGLLWSVSRETAWRLPVRTSSENRLILPLSISEKTVERVLAATDWSMYPKSFHWPLCRVCHGAGATDPLRGCSSCPMQYHLKCLGSDAGRVPASEWWGCPQCRK